MSKHAHKKFEMADSCCFEKKIEKSTYLRNGLTDRHDILHNDASEQYAVLKIPVFKNPRWRIAAILKDR